MWDQITAPREWHGDPWTWKGDFLKYFPNIIQTHQIFPKYNPTNNLHQILPKPYTLKHIKYFLNTMVFKHIKARYTFSVYDLQLVCKTKTDRASCNSFTESLRFLLLSHDVFSSSARNAALHVSEFAISLFLPSFSFCHRRSPALSLCTQLGRSHLRRWSRSLFLVCVIVVVVVVFVSFLSVCVAVLRCPLACLGWVLGARDRRFRVVKMRAEAIFVV